VLAASIIIALMIGVPSTSETSVSFYQTTRRNIPEDKSSSRCVVFEVEIEFLNIIWAKYMLQGVKSGKSPLKCRYGLG
jgi:hypothetical protein